VPDETVTWTSQRRESGVLVVSFHGRGDIGSDGNPAGRKMREAMREEIAASSPAGVIVDLTDFEYRFGDYIGTVPLTAAKLLGIGRACVVARGETGAALQSLWDYARLDKNVPLFAALEDAEKYLSKSERHTE